MKNTSSILSCLVILFAIATLVQGKTSSGIIAVDDFTFDKIIGIKDTFVEFVEYSWTGRVEYDAASKEYDSDNDLLFLRLDFSESPKLKERFATEKGSIKFFPKGSVTPTKRFTGKIDSGEIIDFVVLNTHDKLEHICDFVSTFVESTDQPAVIKEVEEKTKDFSPLELSYTNNIIAHMKKITAKGVEYIETEIYRLKGLIRGKTTEEKKREFKKRLSTLRIFGEHHVAADAKPEKPLKEEL